MGQTLVLLLGSGILNLSYFICGIFDSRVTALAKKRHHRDGWLIDLCRLFVLVRLQIIFYIAFNLG